MAKFVIAGKADCPRFARTEMLAEKLSGCLPHFRLHKVVHSSADWPSWLQEQCTANGWTHSSSPLVWRELVDRGGKGLYLGGLEEFTEYAAHYYNVQPTTDAALEGAIAAENHATFESDQLQAANAPKLNLLRVAITNASSSTAYHLSELIATGNVFGDEQKVALQLYDLDRKSELEGLKMELEDLASPLLIEVIVAMTLQEVYNSVITAFILDFPYEGTETQVDSTVLNRYHDYAKTIDFCSSKDVRVIVSGSHGNLGASIIAKYATSITRSNIIAASCLVEQQAKSIVAQKLLVNGSDISQVCVWGRTCGPEALVDIAHTQLQHFNGSIVGPDPYSLPITRCVFESDWMSVEFPSLLSARHGSFTGYQAHSSGDRVSLVEAVGLARLVRAWEGCGHDWVPVGVVCEGGEEWYDVPEGVVCSLPTRSVNGEWVVVNGIPLKDEIKESLSKQVSLLKTELDNAIEKLQTDLCTKL